MSEIAPPLGTEPHPLEVANVKAALAAELAAYLLPLPDILEKYGMTPAQLRQLLRDPQFFGMVEDFRKQWNSPMSAQERIKAKAAIMVEDGLLEVRGIFQNPQLNASARLDAFKQITQLSDTLPRRENEGTSGPRFSLTLNLGGDKSVTIDDAPTAERLDGKEAD